MGCSWMVQPKVLAAYLQEHAPLAVQQNLVLKGAVLGQCCRLPQDSLGLRHSVGMQALVDASRCP